MKQWELEGYDIEEDVDEDFIFAWGNKEIEPVCRKCFDKASQQVSLAYDLGWLLQRVLTIPVRERYRGGGET